VDRYPAFPSWGCSRPPASVGQPPETSCKETGDGEGRKVTHRTIESDFVPNTVKNKGDAKQKLGELYLLYLEEVGIEIFFSE